MMCMSKYKTNKITKFILNLHNVLCGSFIVGIYLPRKSSGSHQEGPVNLKMIKIILT